MVAYAEDHAPASAMEQGASEAGGATADEQVCLGWIVPGSPVCLERGGEREGESELCVRPRGPAPNAWAIPLLGMDAALQAALKRRGGPRTLPGGVRSAECGREAGARGVAQDRDQMYRSGRGCIFREGG
jgi:hypothetical protein